MNHDFRKPVSTDEIERCPICDVPFEAGDTCATDINLGMCHAACLEGSPVVNLHTEEPSDGPISTYPYEPEKPMSTDNATEALIKRLQEKRVRVHDLSGVGYEPDPDCELAATTLRAQQDRIRELEAERSRLADDNQSMACDEAVMTAAENVLAWLVTVKIGCPDLCSYTPFEAQKIIEEAIEAGRAAEAKLAEAMEVIKPFASVRYMGANAFNRADLSDNDFRAARTLMQKMEGGDA